MTNISLVIGALIAGLVGILSSIVVDYYKRWRDNKREKKLMCQALVTEISENQNLIINKKRSLLDIRERSSPELARADKDKQGMFMETVKDIYRFERSVYATSCDKIGILGDEDVQRSIVGYYSGLRYLENFYPTTVLALWEIMGNLDSILSSLVTEDEERLSKHEEFFKREAKESQDSLIANFDEKANELCHIGEELIKKLREIDTSS